VVQIKLGNEKEVVCLAMKHDLLAVGSQRQVTLLDPRLRGPAFDIANVDSHDGVHLPSSSKWAHS
jgi:mitochondrial fission protein ELM1